MRQTIEQFIAKTEKFKSVNELFREFDNFVGSYGVDVSSYHITAENLQTVPIEVGLIRENFPDNWVRQYIENEYGRIDPVIEQSRRESRPFHWFEIGQKVKLTEQQQGFLDELKEAGLTDGIAVPIFGPMGTMAYFGLGACEGKLDLPSDDLTELQFACQQVHNRYLEISGHNEARENVKLSKREKQVLTLVATGLSNSGISDRLSITENTVDTMLRRCFAKLGVKNRLSAVLRGIGAGLILP